MTVRDELAAATRATFAVGVPNGWVLGWNRVRFEKELAALACPFSCLNATSFDYARCNRYEIECRTDGASSYLMLTVLISFVVDVFSTHWTRYEKGGRSGTVVATPNDSSFTGLEGRIAEMLRSKGFRRLPDDLYNAKIVGIELELSDPGDVTLGKCLFEDSDG